MILNFRANPDQTTSGQTVQTQIRLQPDLGIHCLPLHLHFWRYHTIEEPFSLNFRVFTVKLLGVL